MFDEDEDAGSIEFTDRIGNSKRTTGKERPNSCSFSREEIAKEGRCLRLEG
jgi:hypothetical protein